MLNSFRVIFGHLKRLSADYLSFTDPKDIAAMSRHAPDWVKVLQGGETRFYAPDKLNVLDAAELGFSGNQKDLNEQLKTKGYVSFNNPEQVKLMQEIRPNWLKVLKGHEVRFYPPSQL